MFVNIFGNNQSFVFHSDPKMKGTITFSWSAAECKCFINKRFHNTVNFLFLCYSLKLKILNIYLPRVSFHKFYPILFLKILYFFQQFFKSFKWFMKEKHVHLVEVRESSLPGGWRRKLSNILVGPEKIQVEVGQ